MNTFTGREWGSGTEDEKLFAPKSIDADQWLRAYEAAGAEQLLNVPPNLDGRIADADVASLTAFGKAVRSTYGTDAVEARIDGSRQRIAEGTTIGNRRILPLASPVTATAVRVKVLESRAAPHLGATTLHLSSTG
nr:hypothetical protein OG781_15375 [Streptomyces sp. NBC_00830]